MQHMLISFSRALLAGEQARLFGFLYKYLQVDGGDAVVWAFHVSGRAI